MIIIIMIIIMNKIMNYELDRNILTDTSSINKQK